MGPHASCHDDEVSIHRTSAKFILRPNTTFVLTHLCKTFVFTYSRTILRQHWIVFVSPWAFITYPAAVTGHLLSFVAASYNLTLLQQWTKLFLQTLTQSCRKQTTFTSLFLLGFPRSMSNTLTAGILRSSRTIRSSRTACRSIPISGKTKITNPIPIPSGSRP